MALDVTAAPNPTLTPTEQIQKMQDENQAFQVTVQQASAAISTAGIATNLITSAHSTASNAAKNVGQGMVESSRR